MENIRVDLGARAYSIHIGRDILDDESLYAPHVGAGSSVAVITNTVVAPLYLERVRNALAASGTRILDIVVDDGESAKEWHTLDRVFDALLQARCDRQTLIVALGGGVIGDLAGFAAAVYQRGISFIQVPTTLLAQVDSSVGGKTAINHPRGKNMIGAFHQPHAVITDIATLDTLPERELRAGLAEVIKHGLALDAAFTQWLEGNMERLLARDPAAIIYAIRRSCELKAQIVAADERESGRRALLNFGHTFGHAIETGLGYGTWLHGEAVAVGMVMATELSARCGLVGTEVPSRVRMLIGRAGLPVEGPDMLADRYLELMSVDKKAAQGRTRFVLLEAIGQSTLRAETDERRIRDAIRACTRSTASAH